PGKNTIKVWASNADGRSLESGTLDVEFKPGQPPAPPEVELIDPPRDLPTIRAERTVRFRVKSARPLSRVELVRDTREPLRKGFAVAQVKPDEQGYYEFEGTIPLAQGENRLRVTAVNAGGEQNAAVMVNYVHLPVRLVIDGIEPAPGAPLLLPEWRHDGQL